MKKYNILLGFCVLLLSLNSCKEEPTFGDAVYMTGTLTSPTVKFLVDGQSSIGLTVTSTEKATSDVTVSLKPAPELLETFNVSTGRNCQLPPEGSYSVDGKTVVIKSGGIQSSQLEISANSEALKEGVSYCLPMSIESVEGADLNVLESSRTAYVMMTKVINVKAAYLARSGCFDIPSFAGENSPVKELKQMTLEMKVLPVSFPTIANSAEGISSLCGCEENFLFRFGDGAGKPTNKLQLAAGSIGTSIQPYNKDHYDTWCDKEFETGKWLHFAAVFDGKYLKIFLDGEQIKFIETKNGGSINLSTAYNGHDWSDTFAIGRSVGYSRFFDGYISECRVWNVARTPAELEDGICYVNPTTPGLVAYWRFNGELQDDGTVLDETGHGYNAHPWGSIRWVDNQKCPF